MCIEQSLMRPMKTDGGLTQRRGIAEEVISRLVNGAPALCEVVEKFEDFCGVTSVISHQHIELLESRIKRDKEDVKKFLDFFQTHPPFFSGTGLISLATGVFSDSYHKAYKTGTTSMLSMVNNNFGDFKLSTKKKFIPLGAINCGVKINDVSFPIDTNLLYQRIISTFREDDDLEEYFQFEPSPVPQKLYDDLGMKKTTKSALYTIFEGLTDHRLDFKKSRFVVDGGFLLHKVVWPRQLTYLDVISAYVTSSKYITVQNVLLYLTGMKTVFT